jgi:hypothetical protein
MPRWAGLSKYDPLTRYLAGLAEDEATLTFAEIESIVGATLPPSAWQSSYWTRTPRPWGAHLRPWTRGIMACDNCNYLRCADLPV